MRKSARLIATIAAAVIPAAALLVAIHPFSDCCTDKDTPRFAQMPSK